MNLAFNFKYNDVLKFVILWIFSGEKIRFENLTVILNFPHFSGTNIRIMA